jgi:hypothetical protein
MLPGLPPTTLPTAFADESFQEHPTEGFSVLAAAVIEARAQQPTREVMRRLLGSRRTATLHRHEMDRLQQKDAAQCVAGIEGFHVVDVGSPVPRHRQERAQAACLTALAGELQGTCTSKNVRPSATRLSLSLSLPRTRPRAPAAQRSGLMPRSGA